MKTLIAVLTLVSIAWPQQIIVGRRRASSGGSASFTSIVQKVSGVYNTNCGFSSPTDCTMTISSTGAGHLLVVAATRNGNAAEYISTITAGACSGSWQYPAGSHATGGSGIVDYAYCLSSNSGVTSVTVEWTNWQGRPVLMFYEISYTGTPSFVNASATFNSSNTTTPPGVALTLSGAAKYLTCQLVANSNGALASITSPYSADFSNVVTADTNNWGGFACALNNASGSAPTWTNAVVSSTTTVSGLAMGVN